MTKHMKKIIEVLSVKIKKSLCDTLVIQFSGVRPVVIQKLFSSLERARAVDGPRYRVCPDRPSIGGVTTL